MHPYRMPNQGGRPGAGKIVAPAAQMGPGSTFKPIALQAAARQGAAPGSSFKPFGLATAMRAGGGPGRNPACPPFPGIDSSREHMCAAHVVQTAPRGPRNRIRASLSALTDQAYFCAYPSAPQKIPADWQEQADCIPWALAWFRLRAKLQSFGVHERRSPPSPAPGEPQTTRVGGVAARRGTPNRNPPPAAGDTWWEQGLPPQDAYFHAPPQVSHGGKTLDPAWNGARTRYMHTLESGAFAFQVKFSAMDQGGKWWICLYERPTPAPWVPLPLPHESWSLSGCTEYSPGAGIPAGGQQVGDLQVDPPPGWWSPQSDRDLTAAPQTDFDRCVQDCTGGNTSLIGPCVRRCARLRQRRQSQSGPATADLNVRAGPGARYDAIRARSGFKPGLTIDPAAVTCEGSGKGCCTTYHEESCCMRGDGLWHCFEAGTGDEYIPGAGDQAILDRRLQGKLSATEAQRLAQQRMQTRMRWQAAARPRMPAQRPVHQGHVSPQPDPGVGPVPRGPGQLTR